VHIISSMVFHGIAYHQKHPSGFFWIWANKSWVNMWSNSKCWSVWFNTWKSIYLGSFKFEILICSCLLFAALSGPVSGSILKSSISAIWFPIISTVAISAQGLIKILNATSKLFFAWVTCSGCIAKAKM